MTMSGTTRGRRIGELAFLLLENAFLELVKAGAARNSIELQRDLVVIRGNIVFHMQQIIAEQPELINTNILLDAVSSVRSVLTNAGLHVPPANHGKCENEQAAAQSGTANENCQSSQER